MTEWNAAGYSRIAQLQQHMAAEAMSLLDLSNSARVLDVGCGNGNITARIAAAHPGTTVVGVDASEDMIAFASTQLAATSHPNLHFQRADARWLPFHNKFDVVVSFNALHWIPDQDVVLHSIRGAMKQDAGAHLRLVPKGERKSLEDVIEETRRSERWAGAFNNFQDPYLHWTPEQYANAAEQSQFRVESVRTEDKAWDFESRDAFAAFGMVTFVEWTKLLPEQERPAFVTDVLDRYRQVTGPGGENVFEFYQMDITLTAL
jgi:trans-aconitate 2-methyltransferase